MVEELLGALGDWRGTQDIIRLTIKALTEVVKTQNNTISSINRQVASKTDVQMFKDFEEKIQLKVLKIEEVVQEKASRKEMAAGLNGKASQEFLKNKVELEEFYSECKETTGKIERVQAEFNKKFLDLSVDKELQRLDLEIKSKLTWKEIENVLDEKLSKDALAVALSKKVTRSDVEELLRTKADSAEISKISAKLESKIEKTYFESMIAGIDKKVVKHSESYEKFNDRYSDDVVNELQEKICSLQKMVKSEVEGLKKQIAVVNSKKADFSEVESVYEAIKQKADFRETAEVIERLSKDLQSAVGSWKKRGKSSMSADVFGKITEDISKIRNQMIEVLEDRKKDTIYHSEFFKEMSAQVKKETQEAINKQLDHFDQFKDSISSNFARKQDFLSAKQDFSQVSEQKLNKEEFSQFLPVHQDLLKSFQSFKKSTKAELLKFSSKFDSIPQVPKEKTSIADMIISKADKSETISLASSIQSLVSEVSSVRSELKSNNLYISNVVSEVKACVEDLDKEVKLKGSTKDILALMENKANIEDTNKALIEIHQELDGKVDTGHYSRYMTEIEQSLGSLWSANGIGRWGWKNGDLKHGNLIPWETQYSNTLPENFMWEKEKTSILTMSAGVYFINFAIFSKKKLRVQFLVNGENALDTGNKANIPSNKIFSEFLLLPARARISVVFIGDSPGQAYLDLLKIT